MRLTHKHSQGLFMTVLGGRCPYVRFCLLFLWQDLQDFAIDQMVVCIPFQYIAAFIVSLRGVVQGAVGSGDTIWLHTLGVAWG